MKKEEKLLFLKAQKGDEGAFEKLYTTYRPLIYFVLNKFSDINADRFGEDHNSEYEDYCVDALMNAIMTFDVTKNFEFTTYAVQCLKHAILTCKTKWKSRKKIEFKSLDDMFSEDLTFQDVISDGVYEETCEKETTLSVYKKYELFMPENVKWILLLMGVKGLNASEVASEMKVSRQCISNKLVAYRKKLLLLKNLARLANSNKFHSILGEYHSQNLVQVYNFFNFGEEPPLDYLKQGIQSDVWLRLYHRVQEYLPEEERCC